MVYICYVVFCFVMFYKKMLFNVSSFPTKEGSVLFLYNFLDVFVSYSCIELNIIHCIQMKMIFFFIYYVKSIVQILINHILLMLWFNRRYTFTNYLIPHHHTIRMPLFCSFLQSIHIYTVFFISGVWGSIIVHFMYQVLYPDVLDSSYFSICIHLHCPIS